MNAPVDFGVPAPLVASPIARRRDVNSVSFSTVSISLLSRSMIGAGVLAGATMANQPSIAMPGIVSEMVGMLSMPGNRASELMATIRSLPELASGRVAPD